MNGDLISRSALLESIEGTDWYTIRYDGSVSDGAPCEEVAWYKATEIYAALEKAPAVEAEPVVHAHWKGDCCSRCGELAEENYPRCPNCGAHMDEHLEIRTCYCPICDKHFEVRSNDSMGSCPDCGHHVVLHGEGEE